MIHIFYHVATVDSIEEKDTETFVNFYTRASEDVSWADYKGLFRAQIGSLIKYFRQEENVECKLNICIVGDGEVSLPKNFDDYWGDELNVIKLSSNINDGEIITLDYLHKYCEELPDDDVVLYFHTKGVSVGTKEREEQRLYLEKTIFGNIDVALDKLKKYDVVGIGKSHQGEKLGYYGTPDKPFNFPTNNFWWANVSYIKRLPNIYSFDLDYDKIYIKERGKGALTGGHEWPEETRYLAEQWIGYAQPKVHDLVKNISIITSVTKPHNVEIIKNNIQSIDKDGWDVEWVLIIDDSLEDFKFDIDEPWIQVWFKPILGWPGKLDGINWGLRVANHELVYRCDDDNLVHPNFFKGLTELTKQDAKMYIVAQDCDEQGYGGIVKTDEWFRCGNIDTAQMIFKNPYQEFKYEGTPPQDPKDTKHIDIQEDWHFANEFRERYGVENMVFSDEVLCYYNRLSWDINIVTETNLKW
jgi:hypothetical protein